MPTFSYQQNISFPIQNPGRKLHSFGKISSNVFSLVGSREPTFESPHWECPVVDVDVSCSGFMEAGSMRSLGLLPMANSTGVLPLRVTCVFLTVAALRNNWAGAICNKVVLTKFCGAIVSTSAERNFLNNRTPISARFGNGMYGPVRCFSHYAFDRMPAYHGDDGNPCLHISPSKSSGKIIHPLEKFGKDLWWRGALTWIWYYVWSSTIQHNQKSKSLLSNFCRGIFKILLLFIR